MTARALALTLAGVAIAGACGSAGLPQPPDLRGAPVIAVPAFVSSRLDNGLELLVNVDDRLPIVAIAVALRGGSLADPPEQAGLAMLLGSEMIERTQKWPRVELARALDAAGARLGARVSPDAIAFDIEVLADRTEAALDLLAEILRRPQFEAADHERVRGRTLAHLEVELSDPENVAELGLRQVIFGGRHPFALPQRGTRRSLGGLSLDDVRARYRRSLRPENISMAVAGAVDVDVVRRWVARRFGGWRVPGPAGAAPVSGPGLDPAPRTKIYYVPRPGLPQTVIYLGSRGLPEGDPRALRLRMITGRVPESAERRLRGVDGMSYGVTALHEVTAQTGYYGIRLTVAPGDTGQALKSVLNRYDAQPGGSLERESVRLLLEETGGFHTILGRAIRTSRLRASGLPADHWRRVSAELEDDRGRDEETLVFDFLRADRQQVVLVGDPDVIKAQVPPLGLGPLQLLELTP